MLYGFDVGGTKIAFCVYDEALSCLFEDQIPTPHDYQTFLSSIETMVHQADAKFNCKGQVGLGFPGAINASDMTLYCANVPALKGRPLFKDLSAILDREVKIENDANCFLLSEYFGGSADGCKTVLGVTLGTGVGGAICIDGKTLVGQNSFAGEIGHYPLPATILKKYPELPNLTCGCGRQMCLETYVSGTGLGNLYEHYASSPLKGPAILNKFRAGDKIAQKVINIYFDILAAGIATAIMVLDADAIIFGGGLSKFEILIDEFTQRLPKHLLNDVKLPKVAKATFGGEGGVRGAALLNYQK
ncbi:transcriptional regulator [Psychromonas marina]|uniref:N-acetylglucosamine kinase n=1 Tax=Psychromonas marina TaxID=88364 RepID=A0ABQ6E2H7_9GAMM|nr:ROK family protein [Psychromonas marina]GLS91542.1 transcriptional regulator [Psychromonas marina]